MQLTKYQCTQRANLKNPHTYIYTCNIPNINVLNLNPHTYIYIHACEERETIKKITQINT